MLTGHYGLALAAKKLAPRPSLGTFFLAAQLADEVWPVLLLLGIEHVRIVPGWLAASPFDFTDYPFSHSLAMGLLAGLVLGGLYYAFKREQRGAIVVGLLVVSHWLLDFPMHTTDLPLWPGGPKVGLGGWRSIPFTLLAEGGFLGGGLWIYLRATVARDRIGTWALWGFIATLVAVYLSTLFSPPPSGTAALAWGGLTLWLFVPWGYWIDRHRAPRQV